MTDQERQEWARALLDKGRAISRHARAKQPGGPAAAVPRKARGKQQRPIPREVPACMHRLFSLGLVPCQTCQGKRVELIGCAVKGRCTVDPDRRAEGVQRCQTCTHEPKVRPT